MPNSDVIVTSDESEGLFNEFIQDQLEEILDEVINRGDLDRLGDRGSDVIIEIDDIVPPTFVYGDDAGGAGGGGGQGPGAEKGKLRFRIPFQAFMELVGQKLKLPNLVKEGDGKIKEVSYTFKTFGQVGVILDKRRTFKRALRSSVVASRTPVTWRPGSMRWSQGALARSPPSLGRLSSSCVLGDAW